MTKTMAANTNTNPMRNIEVEKVVINMGVGESGEKLAKAEKLLERIASQKPIELHAKRSLQPLGIKKGEAIACKVTLRKGRAKEFLKRCFKIQEPTLAFGTTPRWEYMAWTFRYL